MTECFKDIMKDVSEGDLLEIRWIDAEEQAGWTPVKELKNSKCPQCKTYGLFISEDEQCIILAPTVSDNLEIRYAKIPKGMITKIRKIEDSELDDWI